MGGKNNNNTTNYREIQKKEILLALEVFICLCVLYNTYIHTIFIFAARLVLWILVGKGEGIDYTHRE